MHNEQNITNYGLVGPTTGGIRWLGTPEAVAEAWFRGDFPNAVLRLSINGEVRHGTAEQVAPVYAALNALTDKEN